MELKPKSLILTFTATLRQYSILPQPTQHFHNRTPHLKQKHTPAKNKH